MAEARIIPIKPEQATDEAPRQRRTTRTAQKSTRAANGAKPADGEKPEKTGKPEAAKPAKRRAAPAKSRAPKAASRQDSAVQPPEELRDLGTFVANPAKAEPTHADPAQVAPDQPEPQPEARVWPDKQPDSEPEPAATERPGDEWERKVAGALAFVRRRLTGEYEVDEFGFDAELTTTVLAAPLRPVYEKWFRVEVTGLENVPDKGGALIVANHSGVIALDGAITALALLDHHPARRHLRMLGADLVFKTPFLGAFARKAGNTLACNADAERLLSSGELVGVYPEGFKGVGKPFSERYKLQRFGRGGFVSAALRTRAPIIPCSIVGAEEIYPLLGNAKMLARLLGLPYFPLTPTFPWLGPLGMIPLPSKWYIEFGEPIETESLADRADDPMLTFNVADQVRETIQQTLYRLLMKRKSVFS